MCVYKPKTKCHINLRVVRPQASGHIISFVYFNFLEAQGSSSVGKRIREGRRRKADLLVGRVEHGIEPLQEREPVDEIEPLALVVADVPDDQIHIVRRAADVRVERQRPRLCVRRELEGCLNFSNKNKNKNKNWSTSVKFKADKLDQLRTSPMVKNRLSRLSN